ncbi:unnamed protein product [Caenorhabditis bovis]|uniref:Uncharacterized protein n=1 Tax=Caenorhabditis bovis TaxID=2654633 RepID=A0A8S1FCG3_9PELO|nr:unnamed protein product [Caenorhabditis bovis]
MSNAEPSTSLRKIEEEILADEKFAPLAKLAQTCSTDALADHLIGAVDWKEVEEVMPKFLKLKTVDDVKQLLIEQMDGMSSKRLVAVLNGSNTEESSSSEEDEANEVEEAVCATKEATPVVDEKNAEKQGEDRSDEAAADDDDDDDDHEQKLNEELNGILD